MQLAWQWRRLLAGRKCGENAESCNGGKAGSAWRGWLNQESYQSIQRISRLVSNIVDQSSMAGGGWRIVCHQYRSGENGCGYL